MAALAELPAFEHDPLPDSKTHIRLLEILQVGPAQHITCAMSTWPLNAAPSYYAISYTWGNMNSLASITLNEKIMGVGQNCQDAMIQVFARKTKRIRYTWIDAICIDQTSTQEKNHQVALMGEVYKNAACVLACVGAHSHDSEFLVEFCRKKKRLLESIHGFSQHFPSTEWSLRINISEKRVLTLRCLRSMSLSTRHRVANAFVSFMLRPYFTRLWILQELFMGRKVMFCCDTAHIPAEQLLALHPLVDPRFCPKWSLFIHNRLMTGTVWHIFLLWRKAVATSHDVKTEEDFANVEPHVGCLALAASRSNLRRLHDILPFMEYFRCTDKRDKLYGIMSLIDWYPSGAPHPNYHRHRLDLALDVFELIIEERVQNPNSQRSLYEDYALSWAARLVKIFDLSTVDFNEIIRRKPQSGSNHNADNAESFWHHPRRICDPVWDAVRISAYSSASCDLNQVYCTEGGPGDDYLTLVDAFGVPFAQGPLDIQAGDWYVQMMPAIEQQSQNGERTLRRMTAPPGWKRTGMIVRESALFHLSIVGLTHGSDDPQIRWPREYGSTRNIHIHWDMRDVLLAFLTMPNPDDIDAKTLVASHVCATRNSSFAVFPSLECQSRMHLQRNNFGIMTAGKQCTWVDLNRYNPNEASYELVT